LAQAGTGWAVKYDKVRVALGLAHMADDLKKYAVRTTCPVAILRGSHSSELTLEEAKRVAGFWKNASVIDVEGDYALQMENPTGLAEALIRWTVRKTAASPAFSRRGRVALDVPPLHRHVHRAVFPLQQKEERRAVRVLVDDPLQRGHILDRLTIDLEDDVARAEAGVGGAAAVLDAPHHHAPGLLETELSGHGRRHRLHSHAELALLARIARDLLVGLVELRHLRRELHGLAVTQHGHRHLATGWSLRHEARQSLRAGHLVAVELRDDVARLHPRLHGRGAIGGAPDRRSLARA